jgi:hypothetical protein
MSSRYRAPWWLPGGHAQTVYSAVVAKPRRHAPEQLSPHDKIGRIHRRRFAQIELGKIMMAKIIQDDAAQQQMLGPGNMHAASALDRSQSASQIAGLEGCKSLFDQAELHILHQATAG